MSQSPSGPSIGTLLGDKYRLTSEIGRGGMATIYAAENVTIGKRVAVKILAEELTHSRTVNERFIREARAAAKLTSPYICEVYDVGTVRERPFIVMELLQGQSLFEHLSLTRQLPQEEVFRIAWQVGKGLSRAHRAGVVHRDLKPENIFLCTTDEGEPTCKIVDFGLAKFYEPARDPDNARLTKEGALFGTPAYMSPEQATGQSNVDARADLWALGCIVYEMLTGSTVWDVGKGVPMILAQIATAELPSARKYRPDLPLTFDAWFARALARDATARFQSVDEFLGALGHVLPTPPHLARYRDDSASNPFTTLPGGVLPPPPGASPPQKLSPAPKPPPNLSPAPKPELEAATQAAKRPRLSRPWLWAAAACGLVLVLAGSWRFGLFATLATSGLSPAEQGPDAADVNRAQALLSDRQAERALNLLQGAFEKGRGKAVRSLHDHVSAALDPEGNGRCSLAAVGHPRPFSRNSSSSAAALLPQRNTTLVAWADSDTAGGSTQVFSTRLDHALRRVSPPVNITPEATDARDPQLLALADGAGLLFWDIAGSEPGVFVRMLSPEGHATSARQLLSQPHDKNPYDAAWTQDADGNVWVVWVEPTRTRVHDLVLRKLSPSLRPLSDAKTITAYPTPAGNAKTHAAEPSIAYQDGLLHISFTLRRAGRAQILLLRAAPEAVERGTGVAPEAATSPPLANNEEFDRYLGQALALTKDLGSYDLSQIACGEKRCLIVWDEAPRSAWLAGVDSSGQVLWRRQLEGEAARPAIGFGEGQWLESWFADHRVLAAPIQEGTPLGRSVVGKVSATLSQPNPQLIKADARGEWYIAWRGYEAAAEEPFVARVRCQ